MLQNITRNEVKQQAIELFFKSKLAGTLYVEYDFVGKMGQEVGKKLLKGLNLGGAATGAASE